MKQGSQEYDVLMCLENGKAMTQNDAFFELGVGRLAAIVCNLRKLGYDIETEMISVIKKNGRKTSVARYRLRSEDNG